MLSPKEKSIIKLSLNNLIEDIDEEFDNFNEEEIIEIINKLSLED